VLPLGTATDVGKEDRTVTAGSDELPEGHARFEIAEDKRSRPTRTEDKET
jgi:hypothetical protein